jgi:addiction module RelE/StbE family toxin
VQINWWPAALDDLGSLRTYIAQFNPQAARRTRKAISAAVATLADTPELGRPGRVEETRELPVPHTSYLLAYTVVDSQFTILAAQHGARGGQEGSDRRVPRRFPSCRLTQPMLSLI